jgi:hypothetical protein
MVDRTHPINRGLVGYWQCDGEGVLVPDYSGFGNNGVGTAVGLQDSHHGGNALSFVNASNSAVNVPANAAIAGAGMRSFVGWINPTSTPFAARAIFAYGVNATNNAFDIFSGGAAGGDIYVYGNSNDVRTTSGGLISANTWNHLAVTYNGGGLSTTSLQIYINAVVPSLTLVPGSSGLALNTTASQVQIGADFTGTQSYSGGIEGVRWYNRALDPVEVAQLYAEPYAGIFDAAASIFNSTTSIPPLPLMGQIWLA